MSLKISAIGFSADLREYFDSFCNSYGQDVIISFYDTIEELEDCQIIFFSDEFTNKDFIKDIRKVRNLYPYSAQVVIQTKDDYHILYEFFKMGVCDVVKFPLDERKLNVSIEKARAYNLLKTPANSLNSLITLLNLFSEPTNFKSFDDLFQGLKTYINSYFNLQFLSLGEKNSENQLVLHSFGADELLSGYRVDLSKLDSHKLVHEEFRDHQVVLLKLYQQTSMVIYAVCVIKSSHGINDIFSEYMFKMVKNVIAYLMAMEKTEEFRQLVHKDDVTSLYNYRRLRVDLVDQIRKHKEISGEFSVLFIDIDNFKNVNDSHGHVNGSHMLVDMSHLLRRIIRETDMIYRYGGDEFVIILPECDTGTAKKVGERISKAVRDFPFTLADKTPHKLTVSIGISEYPHDAKSMEDIISVADSMMYQSKKKGKGKVFQAREVLKKLS